jgi:hypothetical protein
MMYEISREVRTLAIKLENERRKKQSVERIMQSSTSTKEQTLNVRERGTEYREEPIYREGFKKIWKKY